MTGTLERRTVGIKLSGIRIEGKRAGAEDGGTAGSGKTLSGYGIRFYDGTPETEYELWEGVVERILPTAADGALTRPDDVRGLFNHNPDNILGRSAASTMRLTKDEKGLRYEIDLPEHAVGAMVREAVQRGDVTGSSFGFTATAVNWRKEPDGKEVREIAAVTLYDVGPVTFPAYEGTTAGVRNLRSAGGDGEVAALQAEREVAFGEGQRQREARARELSLAESA